MPDQEAYASVERELVDKEMEEKEFDEVVDEEFEGSLQSRKLSVNCECK